MNVSPRHFLALLVLFGTISQALPLRRGASLGYHVWRDWSGDSTFATLIVRDSATTDSGIVWTLDLRDSLLSPGRDSFPTGGRSRNDTAQLLVTPTDTGWILPSCLAAIDLSPYGGDSIPAVKGRGVLPPGQVSALCLMDSTRIYRIDKSLQTYAANASEGRNVSPAGPWAIHSASFPSSLWLPEVGVGSVLDVISREEWKLRSFEGRSLARTPWDSGEGLVASLRIGESWLWGIEESTWVAGRTTNSLVTRNGPVRWIVADSSGDSSGWLRRAIRASFPAASSGDSTFQLRIETATGRAKTTSGWDLHRRLADGMWRGWADSALTGDSWSRRRSLGTSTQTMDYFLDSISMVIAGGLGPRRLELEKVDSHFRNSYRLRLRATLTEHDGQALVSAARLRRGTVPKVLGSALDVARFLEGRSGATVRLTSVSGRSETYSGSDVLEVLRSRRGVVLVEIQDRDAVARGTLLLP